MRRSGPDHRLPELLIALASTSALSGLTGWEIEPAARRGASQTACGEPWRRRDFLRPQRRQDRAVAAAVEAGLHACRRHRRSSAEDLAAARKRCWRRQYAAARRPGSSPNMTGRHDVIGRLIRPRSDIGIVRRAASTQDEPGVALSGVPIVENGGRRAEPCAPCLACHITAQGVRGWPDTGPSGRPGARDTLFPGEALDWPLSGYPAPGGEPVANAVTAVAVAPASCRRGQLARLPYMLVR